MFGTLLSMQDRQSDGFTFLYADCTGLRSRRDQPYPRSAITPIVSGHTGEELANALFFDNGMSPPPEDFGISTTTGTKQQV